MSAPDELFEEGRALQQAGQSDRAERAYLRALQLRPGHAQTLAALAGLYVDCGRPENAVPLLQRALAANPLWADGYLALGIAQWQRGATAEAEAALRKATRVRPGLVQAHFRLGELLAGAGRADDARTSLLRALKLDPGHAGARAALDSLFPESSGEPRAVSARDEQRARSLFNLGLGMHVAGRLEEAASSYRSAADAWPEYLEAVENLAAVLFALGRYAESAQAYARAAELRPENAAALAGLGASLLGAGEPEKALPALRRALGIDPDQPQASAALGAVLARLGRMDEAIPTARKAVALHPGSADAHFSLAHLLLQNGDFEEGWREFEWRKQTRHYTPPKVRGAEWDGRPLDGETLLVTMEQGYGDAIQFARFLPDLKERGVGRVILACYPALLSLFAGCAGFDGLARLDNVTGEMEPVDFDLRASLLSLPLLLGSTLETLPARVPYISTAPERVARWRARLDASADLRVGLRWTTGTRLSGSARSFSVPDAAPLVAAANARFYSLEAGPGAERNPDLPAGMELVDFGDDILPFEDTAALIAGLDLVITVDTVIAHLAGALGAPVWIALEHASEWRWMRGRSDSPWYPTARLFRQPAPGDWQSVFLEMARELASRGTAWRA
jgi:tetratricopeptide (TPR) repeat protein